MILLVFLGIMPIFVLTSELETNDQARIEQCISLRQEYPSNEFYALCPENKPLTLEK